MSALRVEDLGTILSVWAHPDDETYVAGAVMAGAVDAGQHVTCVSMTAGELGTEDPDRWPPERLARRRRREAIAAMAVLGVRDHRIVGLRDGELASIGDDDGAELVAGLIEELRPDTILTFGPDGMTYHPDHIAVSRWVRCAWERTGTTARLLQATVTVEHFERFLPLYEEWGVFMEERRPEPSADPALSLTAAGDALDRKVAALAAMASQTAGAIAQLGEDLYEVMNADEAFVEVRR